ncbi:DUF2637 domain-containing protein [Actinophytocola sp.]|uniref:DUF2637 domain-containing protein n=1 Tax=Actinophytocola sp. TaxID=1872138 RepID=UPI003899EF9C
MTDQTRAARVEAAAQVTIMLVMGVTAACASFTHIHDLTVRYGQQSWMGWANAVVVELMSIAAGLELRRRKRTGQHTGFVYLVLCAAALVSLAAQVAEAQPSVWGWIVAALPALGFLAVVKIVLSRTPAASGPDPVDASPARPDRTADRTGSPVRSAALSPVVPPWTGPDVTPQTGPDRSPQTGSISPADRAMDRTADVATVEPGEALIDDIEPRQPAPPRHEGTRSDPHVRRPTTTPAVARRPASTGGVSENPVELLRIARDVAADLQESNGKITRNGLARGIRRQGHAIGTDRATDIWWQLQTESSLANSR